MPMRFISEQLAQILSAELRVSVICTDRDLQIVDHTPGLAALLGLEVDDLVSWPLERAIPELHGFTGQLEEVAHGRLLRSALPRLERPASDGIGPRYISVTVVAHDEGQCYLVLLVQDATTEWRLELDIKRQLDDLRLLNAQVEAAHQELVRLTEERSGFLRMAAHDLRNPLNSIQGCLTLISARGRDLLSEECLVLLDIAEDSTKRMGRLIDDLLDIEQLESGTMPLRRDSVDLSVLVEQVGRSYLPLVEKRRLHLEWSVPAGLPQPQGDWDRLVQVLDNLVSNAVKYTPSGGQVRIAAVASSTSVSVEVRDTGLGVSEEEQALLFQRFFRSAAPQLCKVPGTGLGLSIVKAIVEKHGGDVYCDSQLGEGSVFGFTLPLEASPLYEPLGAVPQASP